MPTVEMAARTDAGLASELRLSVMRLRRRLTACSATATSASASSPRTNAYSRRA
jgi:hypothetical protein